MTDIRDAQTVRAVLRRIGARKHTSAEGARERILAMMAALDYVMAHLPEDPPDDVVTEIERVVTTLRTSDDAFGAGNARSGMQTLDLARARLERLSRSLTSV